MAHSATGYTVARSVQSDKDTCELIIIIYVVGLFLAISRVWLLREMSGFLRACHIVTYVTVFGKTNRLARKTKIFFIALVTFYVE